MDLLIRPDCCSRTDPGTRPTLIWCVQPVTHCSVRPLRSIQQFNRGCRLIARLNVFLLFSFIASTVTSIAQYQGNPTAVDVTYISFDAASKPYYRHKIIFIDDCAHMKGCTNSWAIWLKNSVISWKQLLKTKRKILFQPFFHRILLSPKNLYEN